jgi:hypothetical protein
MSLTAPTVERISAATSFMEYLKGLALTFGEDAGVAQLAEQLFCKQLVCL